MDANGKHQSPSLGKGGAVASAFGMNRKTERSTTEDLPSLRAVSIQTQPVTLHLSSSEEGKRLLNQSDSLISTQKASKPGPDSRSSKGVAIRREWKDCNWKVSVLNEVPLDFHLERTKREIEKVSVAEVVQRITKSLRLLSVQAEFDSENAKAKCKTIDMVGFHIRLFAGELRSQEPVIVEIQRRSGSPQCFMRACKKILDAAEGVEIQPESTPARKKIPSCMMKTPISEMKCLKNIVKDDVEIEVTAGISKSLEMLSSKRTDVNVLGLENLCLMTDPLKTRPGVALMACKEMLIGKYCREIRDEIEGMLQRDEYLSKESGVHPFRSLLYKCRHLAVVLLSNILALTSQNGCLRPAIENQKWFTNNLIPMLLDEVKSFEASSNNAYEATCGLASMAKCSDIAKKVMVENSAVDDLKTANNFAIYNHNLLESETRRCLGLMGHPI